MNLSQRAERFLLSPRWPVKLRAFLAKMYQAWEIKREFVVDSRRRVRWMAYPDHLSELNSSDRHLEAQVIKDYHRIEKGLALNQPKRPFGLEVQMRLSSALTHSATTADDHLPSRVRKEAWEALEGLESWNSDQPHSGLDALAPSISSVDLEAQYESCLRLFGSRHSIRDFSDAALPDAVLDNVYRIVSLTPSVCNRASWRLIAVSDPNKREEVLKLQNGNTGFGHSAKLVCIITVDLRLFAGATERNQCWIDGGMFLMNTLMAFHAQGLGACALNWSVGNAKSDEMRDLIGLQPYEEIISLVAAGCVREDFRVARSPRRPFPEIIRDL